MPLTARDDQFTLRGAFAERLTLAGSRRSVYDFLVDADTLLPLVPNVERIVAHGGGAYRLVFAPVGAAGLQFILELEVRVSGDSARTVTLRSIPTDLPPLEPKVLCPRCCLPLFVRLNFRILSPNVIANPIQ